MDEISFSGMLKTSIDVSARLDEFGQYETPLDKSFSRFAFDINAFTSAWGILENTFHDPQHELTGILIHKLNQIISDCNTIFTSLQSRLRSLFVQYKQRRAQVSHGLLCLTGHSSPKKYQPLQAFFADDSVLLARSQIVFATSVLNIVNAVIQHSRVGSFRRSEEVRRQLDACLIEEQIVSRAAVARQERKRQTSGPSALQWMKSLPTDLSAASAVFKDLAGKWVKKSTTILHNAHGHNTLAAADAMKDHIAELIHQKLAEQEQRTVIRIEQLEGQIYDLKSELSTQREIAAGIHRQDQAQIQSLQSQILNQEAQRIADKQLITELTDECEMWKNLARGNGGVNGGPPSFVHISSDTERSRQRKSKPPPNAYPIEAMDRHYATGRKPDSNSGYSSDRDSRRLSGESPSRQERRQDNDSDPGYASGRSRSHSRDSQKTYQSANGRDRTPRSSQNREQDRDQAVYNRYHRRRNYIV